MDHAEHALSSQKEWDRRGLPAWTYAHEGLHTLELNELFLTHWQIAGHVNDMPEPGDFITFDLGPERAVIVRGEDGDVRAFHNLCRHRGSRVVASERGHCKNALVCPFHGWVYNLDGTLRGAARPKTYPAMDRKEWGLHPVEMEIWQGLIFLRFKTGPQAAVQDLLAPVLNEIKGHRLPEMLPTGHRYAQELPVNWKSMCDVDNEGYHVAMAHPALQDLYGSTYTNVEYGSDQLGAAKGTYQGHAGRRWSVRHYVKLSGGPDWLPPERRGVWTYYGLFPNTVLIVTPEALQYYQEIPLAPERSEMRGAVYKYPGEDRKQRLARYLAWRIDRETIGEDVQLSIWSHESMKSSAFTGFYLSDLESGLRWHHDKLRHLFPVMSLDKAPQTDDLAGLNRRMKN